MKPLQNNEKDNEYLISYKYILGDMGIQMLVAINRGAHTKEAIQLLSGVSMACINGRIPVLTSLDLIYIRNDEIYISQKGIEFLSLIKKF